MFRILIVDDHPIMRFGIASIIRVQPDMEVVGQAESGEQAVEAFAKLRPDVTLMDLQLKGMSGVDAIRIIRGLDAAAKIIVLTTYEGEDDIAQALQSGAAGYLLKGMSHDLLMDAIRRVASGKRYVPAQVSSKIADRVRDDELSSREREVLALIAEGCGNKEIGLRLGVTEGTVKCHVGAILSRFQVGDRTQALVVALKRGLIHI